MGNPPLLIVLWFTLTCWPFFHQLLHIQGEFKKYELLKKIINRHDLHNLHKCADSTHKSHEFKKMFLNDGDTVTNFSRLNDKEMSLRASHRAEMVVSRRRFLRPLFPQGLERNSRIRS